MTKKFIESKKSICPECLQVIDAKLYEKKKQIWIKKTCKDHGEFLDLVSRDKKFFYLIKARDHGSPTKIEDPVFETYNGCPYDCGLCPEHRSHACGINIDITDRGVSGDLVPPAAPQYELNVKQIQSLLRMSMSMDSYPLRIQFSGGEPSLHPHILTALKEARDKGVPEIQMASSGADLAHYPRFAREAKTAGLDMISLQFDGVTNGFEGLARGSLWETKMDALDSCRQAGLKVILTPTLTKGINDGQVGNITKVAVENSDVVIGISWRTVSFAGKIKERERLCKRYTLADIAGDLQEQYGGVDKHRDWFPFSAFSPLVDLVNSATNTSRTPFNCHPSCAIASCVLVDHSSGGVIPVSRFVDVDNFLQDIQEEMTLTKDGPRKTMPDILVSAAGKHFYPEWAPAGITPETVIDFINKLVADTDIKTGERTDKREILKVGGYDVIILTATQPQDNYNFDLEKIQRCAFHCASPDAKIYPLCTWNAGPCYQNHVKARFSWEFRSSFFL